MTEPTRREFLQQTGTASLGVAALTGGLNVYAATPESKPKVAFVGCGGRSRSLVQGFANHSEIVWACDPDRKHLDEFQKLSGAKRTTTDLREMLEDENVDAVVIATPDHWHAPAAIMACEAGKHVYVEKPCSHNFREGQLLLEAARRNQVIVQHGTQSRTNPLIVGAMQLLQEGVIGDVLMAKAWNVQRRRHIGHASPSTVPDHLDYDTWVGPAEWMPFQSNRLHYNWHWWHNFGTGDIGNDGAHEIDIARWGLGVSGMPTTASALGGKYYFDDEQEFPDTATCLFEWPGDGRTGQRRQLIFEMRIWSRNYPHNCDTGIEFYGTKGMMFVSKRGKFGVWGDDNKPQQIALPDVSKSLPESHQVDFLNSVRSGESPSADVVTAHDSVTPIHLANISVRIGRSLRTDPVSHSIVGDDEAQALLGRNYRKTGHWGIPKV